MINEQLDSNATTLDVYNGNVERYIETTPSVVDGGVKIWIDTLLVDLGQEAQILEIGSAFGRDATYIEGQGYKVKRTDGSKSFVAYLCENGEDAAVLDVLRDNISDSYDLIFADAVFLHFTKEEFVLAARKACSALSADGKFGLTLKRGEGQEWSTIKLGEPRFYKYWQLDEATEALKLAGFDKVEDVAQDPDWLSIVVSK